MYVVCVCECVALIDHTEHFRSLTKQQEIQTTPRINYSSLSPSEVAWTVLSHRQPTGKAECCSGMLSPKIREGPTGLPDCHRDKWWVVCTVQILRPSTSAETSTFDVKGKIQWSIQISQHQGFENPHQAENVSYDWLNFYAFSWISGVIDEIGYISALCQEVLTVIWTSSSIISWSCLPQADEKRGLLSDCGFTEGVSGHMKPGFAPAPAQAKPSWDVPQACWHPGWAVSPACHCLSYTNRMRQPRLHFALWMAPFHSQKCPDLEDKLNGHLTDKSIYKYTFPYWEVVSRMCGYIHVCFYS